MKLNLGCGDKILEGYDNFDINVTHPKIIWIDLEKRLPFPNGYADEILLDNVIEHIRNIHQLLSECKRVLKPNGKIIAYVPYFRQVGAYRFDHKHFFSMSNLFEVDKIFPARRYTLLFLFQKKSILYLPFDLLGYIVSRISMRVYEYYLSGIIPASQIRIEWRLQ